MNWKSRSGQVRDVADVAGQQVVDADDRIVAIEQRFREMGADESGGAGDDDTFFHKLPGHRLGMTASTPAARSADSSLSKHACGRNRGAA